MKNQLSWTLLTLNTLKYISDKGNVSNRFKKFVKHQKTNNLTNKWAKYLKSHDQENIHVNNKHTKIHSTPFAIRKMLIFKNEI